MVIFTLFVLGVTFIVVFMNELSELLKSLWDSPHFKNIGLLLCLSFFALHYQYPLYESFVSILVYWKQYVQSIGFILRRFEGGQDFSMMLVLFLFTYFPVLLMQGGYFVLKRKRLPHKKSYVWFFWTFFITLLILY